MGRLPLLFRKRFGQLVEFHRIYGHTRVPDRYGSNPSLSRWVRKQRYLKNQGLLLPEREAELLSLGFVWKINKRKPKPTLTKSGKKRGRPKKTAPVSSSSSDSDASSDASSQYIRDIATPSAAGPQPLPTLARVRTVYKNPASATYLDAGTVCAVIDTNEQGWAQIELSSGELMWFPEAWLEPGKGE